MNDTVSRAFRYALVLTDGQEAAVQRQERRLRRAWNRMVNWHRCVLRDWGHGRQTALLAEYRSILESKNGETGRASPAARRSDAIKHEVQRLAKEQNMSLDEAKARLDRENFEPVIPSRDQVIADKIALLQHGDPAQAAASAQKLAKDKKISVEQAAAIVRDSGYGANGTGTGPRRLGVQIAMERLMAGAEYFYGKREKCLLYGMLQKFQKSCENWLKLKGTAQAPCYKREHDRVALQRQITRSTRCDIGRVDPGKEDRFRLSDLSAMIGQEGTRCRTIWHRLLPEGASVTQLAIAGPTGKRELIVFFTCSRVFVLKPFGPSESCVGIDPGLACALTVVSNAYAENTKARRKVLGVDFNLSQKLADDPNSDDGKALAGALRPLERYIFSNNGALELQPPLARDKHFLAKLRRIQRKKDRQKRAANPECFNPDGTWKKGKRARHLTRGLVETHEQEQRLHWRVVNARRDYYHMVGYHLLRLHGHVAYGDWQPEPIHKGRKPLPRGQAKKRRNMNRKALDHAIAFFKAVLQDKAALSASPRTVDIIEEPYTTRTCGCCRAETGPHGPVNAVYWTCSKCGAQNHRKANAAENIRISAAVNAAATAVAHPVAAPA